MAPGVLTDEDRPSNGVSKPTVYVLDKFHPAVEQYARANFNAIFPADKGHAEWRTRAQYLLVRSSKVTAEDIHGNPNLLAIGKQGVGIEKIDSAACKERGIPVLNTPGVNARAVAELVLTLTTAVARGTGTILNRQAQGILVPKEQCAGQTLHGKSIGIIGMGNIGKQVAKIFAGAFESPVIAYDPFLPEGAWEDIPHTRVKDVESVLRTADVVTLHIPLTPETKNMMSLPQFEMMKKTSILINAARGGIVNEVDLEVAMKEKLIWGAGLDCHEEEPPSRERYGRLWELGVVSTPHVGAATDETQMETGMTAARRIYEFATIGKQ